MKGSKSVSAAKGDHPTINSSESLWLRIWVVAFGGFLGLALLKFPNPAVLDDMITPPTNGWEWALMSWPLNHAWIPLGILVLSGLVLMRIPRGTNWMAVLPAAWFGWVVLSAGLAKPGAWSALTLAQHAAAVVCFYLGLLVAGRVRQGGLFFAGLVVATVWVILAGWEQHFGGLETSRKFFYLYTYPTLDPGAIKPEMLKRMNSTRIFSTLFYPNSLAGALLLVVPPLLGLIAAARNQFSPGARVFLAGALGLGAAACLVWSGSKAGWLLALGMAGVVLLKLPLKRRLKVTILVVWLVIGVVGFTVRYLGFFQRGATSVVARADYYRAGLQMVSERTLFGSGPGTFGPNYKLIKPPEAEMAQLAHNDYLQQATDSGLPAGGLFVALIGLVLWRGRALWHRTEWLEWGAWLGLAGFAAQSLVEFGFMVPATAWCWFGVAGWLLARIGIEFDKPKPAS